MNCPECRDWLQGCLDEGRWASSGDVSAHLADCEPCRRDVAAAKILLQGLADCRKPDAAPLMTASIVAAVSADRTERRRRASYRWMATGLLAASVMLIYFVGFFSRQTEPQQPAVVATPTKTPIELAQRADEAKTAVANLTRTVSETTRSRINAFLPASKTIDVELPALPDFEESLDPAGLKAAGLSMAHAFDPVAHSTRQAFGFFARELPVLDLTKN